MKSTKRKRGRVPRTAVRFPTAMVNEVDRLVDENPELYRNRQQFLEDAVREKIEEIRLISRELFLQKEKGETPTSSERSSKQTPQSSK